MAIAGLLLGWVQIVLSILLLVAIFAFFGGLATILAWFAAGQSAAAGT